jgi:hypothetical protein
MLSNYIANSVEIFTTYRVSKLFTTYSKECRNTQQTKLCENLKMCDISADLRFKSQIQSTVKTLQACFMTTQASIIPSTILNPNHDTTAIRVFGTASGGGGGG